MAYEIHNTHHGLILELKGGVTARHAGELGKCLSSSLTSGASVTIRTEGLEDIDSSVLQMLVSLRKSVAMFSVDDPSEVFIGAVDRSALRRELLAGSKEIL
jgi:ABC-type transporter Mla MlaB component